MSAREEILRRVREAVAGAPEAPSVDRSYRSADSTRPGAYSTRPSADSTRPGADSTGLFVERVRDYRAVVETCAEADVEERIALALQGKPRVLVPEGLPWTVPGAVVDAGFPAAELDGFDAVVTGATLGIAETGTIVLTHGPGEGRRAITLVPDVHVCVVRSRDVVAGVPDAVAALDPTRPMTWVSGPSGTSDIELDRVEGVHGPRTLHVLVVG